MMSALIADGAIVHWSRMARVLVWLSVVAITVLSLLPGDYRPHTGAPGRVEHSPPISPLTKSLSPDSV